MSRLEALKSSPLFQNVPLEALKEAEAVVTQRQFRAGETILTQDMPGESLFLLTSGVARVSRMSLGSRERVLGDVYAPGVVGETAVLATSERSATVTALTDVTALLLYRDHFVTILNRHPRVLWNLAAMLTQRVTHLNDELIAFGLNTEAALGHVFTGLYRQRVLAGVSQPEALPLSTHDIMLRIGASRETVARVLRKLSGEGLLRTTSTHITLLNVAALETATLSEDSHDD